MATPATLQRLTRRALITRAKADTGLTAIVPAASIEPMGEPVWPHVIFRSPRTLRLRQSCVQGARVSFDVHVFARERRNVADQVIETGYDHCSRAAAALESALADNRLTLENGAFCKIEFSDSQMLQDEAPDSWHWFAQLNAKVLSAPGA